MSQENLFDKNIAGKIASLDVRVPEQAWHDFSDYLNKTNLERALLFDSAIATAIPAHQHFEHAGQWDLFKEAFDKHNAAQAEDFDTAIRSKVVSGPQPIPPMGFPFPNSKIRVLKYTKIAEAAAILLLLFITWGLLPLLNHSKNGDIVKLENNSSPQQADGNLSVNERSIAATQARPASVQPGIAMGSGQNNKIDIQNDKTFSGNAVRNNAAGIHMSAEPEYSGVHQYQSHGDGLLTPVTAAAVILLHPDDGLVSQLKSVQSILPPIAALNIHEVTAVNQPSVQFIANPFSLPDMHSREGLISRVLVGLRIGPVIDKITTPVSAFGKRNKISRDVNNSLFGFDIELQNKWVNVEAGVTYSFKKYGLHDIDDAKGHFISIPVSFKRTFLKESRINPYVKLGPDFSFVLASQVRPESKTKNQANNIDQYAPSANYITKAKIEDGVLPSGSFSDNSYFGLHAALGIETKINNNMAVMLEINQQFNPFQKELGINNQKFSQTSFAVGFKKLLHFNSTY